MQINTQQIISKARYFQHVDQTHSLKHYIVGEALKASFDAFFDEAFPDYSIFNSTPEIMSFEEAGFFGDIEIENVDYGDFDEKEYEIFKIMRDAERWANANITQLMVEVENQDLMQVVDDQDDYVMGL